MNNPHLPGGSNAVNPAGGSHRTGNVRPDDNSRGTRNDADQDAEAAFEESRHQSASVAKQFARDETDADTQAQT